MAIHHIDMDPVGAGGVDRADLLAQPREIGGEDGRRDADRLLHGIDPNMPRESCGKEGGAIYPRLSALESAR